MVGVKVLGLRVGLFDDGLAVMGLLVGVEVGAESKQEKKIKMGLRHWKGERNRGSVQFKYRS